MAVLACDARTVVASADVIDPEEEDRYRNLCMASAQFRALMENIDTDNTTTSYYSQVVPLDAGGFAHIFLWRIENGE